MSTLKTTRSERFLLKVLRDSVVGTAELALLVAVVAACVGLYFSIHMFNANGEVTPLSFVDAARANIAWTVAAGAWGYFVVVMFLYLAVRVELNLRAIAEGVDRPAKQEEEALAPLGLGLRSQRDQTAIQ